MPFGSKRTSYRDWICCAYRWITGNICRPVPVPNSLSTSALCSMSSFRCTSSSVAFGLDRSPTAMAAAASAVPPTAAVIGSILNRGLGASTAGAAVVVADVSAILLAPRTCPGGARSAHASGPARLTPSPEPPRVPCETVTRLRDLRDVRVTRSRRGYATSRDHDRKATPACIVPKLCPGPQRAPRCGHALTSCPDIV